jgi:hypothetical protein
LSFALLALAQQDLQGFFGIIFGLGLPDSMQTLLNIGL